MTTQWNDEQLAAYALNESSDADRAAIEEAIKTDETARRTVAEFRAAAKLAAEAAKDTATLELTDEQQRLIRGKAREGDARTATRESRARRPWGGIMALAASLLFVFGALIVLRIQAPVFTLGDSISETAHTPSDTMGQAMKEIKLSYQWPNAAAPAAMSAPPPAPAGAPGIGAAGQYDRYINGAYAEAPVEEAVQAQIEPEAKPTKLSVRNASGNTRVSGETQKPRQTESSPAEPQGETLDRYLIKNATLQVETDNAEQASKQLVDSVVAAGGYVSNMNEMVDGLGRRNINLQVRVPADKLDGALQSIESVGRLLNKQVTTQDVTEEYVDTDARIRNLKKTEERLLAHLSQSMLMENTLKVEQEMTRVREQLERLEGRLRFLSHQVRFSTITVNLAEKPKAESVMPVQTFSTGKVFSEAARSLVEFSRGLWVRVVWILVWSPVWGVIAIAGWGTYRLIRKLGFTQPR